MDFSKGLKMAWLFMIKLWLNKNILIGNVGVYLVRSWLEWECIWEAGEMITAGELDYCIEAWLYFPSKGPSAKSGGKCSYCTTH